MLARLREWGRGLQVRYWASERQVCFALQVSCSSFRYRSVAADDFVSGRAPKPGSTMAITGFTSCSGGRSGEIITNAFIDSTASRVCPRVSNTHAGIIRHSVDSLSFMGGIRIMSGVWTLPLTSYLTGVGYIC